MEKKYIDGLIEDINKELNSAKSNCSSEEKKKLEVAKNILESGSQKIEANPKIRFDAITTHDILQAILIVVEIIKEISPHLK